MTVTTEVRPNPIVTAVGNVIGALRKETAERITALEAEVAALRGRALRAVEVLATDDPRTYVLRLTLADGEAIEHTFSLPVPLHCGKWDAERAYRLNDLTAWSGNTWCARRETAGEEPGRTDAWHLVAKQGKRGEVGSSRAIADRLDELEDDVERLEAETALVRSIEDRLEALEHEVLALRAERRKET